MRSALNKIPVSVSDEVNISVLLVSPEAEDASALRGILRDGNWVVWSCSSCADAIAQLEKVRPAVVICERDLPDGSWKDVHAQLEALAFAPSLLVVSRHADEHLWAEVLNLGGYDVLLKPFDASEVARVAGMAWRCRTTAGQMLPGNLSPEFV